MNIKEGERGLKKCVPTNLRLDHYTSQTLCFLILASLLRLGIYNNSGLRMHLVIVRAMNMSNYIKLWSTLVKDFQESSKKNRFFPTFKLTVCLFSSNKTTQRSFLLL